MSNPKLEDAAEEIANLRSLIRLTKRGIRNKTIDPLKGSRVIIRATNALIPLYQAKKEQIERIALRPHVSALKRRFQRQLELIDSLANLNTPPTSTTQDPQPEQTDGGTQNEYPPSTF